MAISQQGFTDLARLRDRVRLLLKAGFKRELAGVFRGTVLKQIADEFRQSRDPYGRPWKPPVLRPGGKPLIDTGAMQSSVVANPVAGGLEVRIGKRYAPTHQYGATIVPKRGKYMTFRAGRGRGARWYRLKKAVIPRRQMLPERDTGGLGPIWSAALNREADRLLRRTMGR